MKSEGLVKKGMTLAERRNEVRVYLEDYGPMHCADIWRDLGIPRGSIYNVLRCDMFHQLRDSRWENRR